MNYLYDLQMVKIAVLMASVIDTIEFSTLLQSFWEKYLLGTFLCLAVSASSFKFQSDL